MDPNDHVPPHLRTFVVRQDPARYTEENQAVWRFIVLSTHARLLETAHHAYEMGFGATGISTDRIPSIAAIDDCLSRFGWRAVAVDGFIPPRAFQAFQARGILPIAAEIRSSKHLTYTPAPDIIHEAAGHAPFLAEPDYARYLRNVGRVAEKSFATRADREVYEAIATLSEVKEDPASTPSQIALAEAALANALGGLGEPSEAAKVARLYWWTAEYGLVGTVRDYRLYGAGLLSSIGEGHFCRDPKVKKFPLTAGCIDVDYDITEAQPQLFVARNFSDLDRVLEEVSRTLAFNVGGDFALDLAQRSEEVATVELDSGVEIVGTVRSAERRDGRVALLRLTGPVAIARNATLVDAMPRVEQYLLPLGPLRDGTSPSTMSTEALQRCSDDRGVTRLVFASGVAVQGRLVAVVADHGRALVALLADLEITRGDQVILRHEKPYPLALAREVKTARAGAVDRFFPPTVPSDKTVPRASGGGETKREIAVLFERAVEAWRALGGRNATEAFERIAARLDEAYPDEWLLRWNLLESLTKVGERGALAERLEADLERLEIRFGHREPILTGLSYIRSLAGPPAGPDRARTG